MRPPVTRTTTGRLTAAAAATAMVATGLVLAVPTSSSAATTSANRADRAIRAAEQHRGRTHFGAAQSFTVANARTDADGTTHVHLDRTYHGLAVLGGDLIVHQSSAGAWDGASLTLHHDLTLATTPKVTSQAASTRALGHLTHGIRKADVRDRTLVVDATGATPRLAWQIETGGVQQDGTPSRLLTYVDARTGAFIGNEQTIETVDGSGQSLYEGTVPLQLTQSGSSYQLKDPTRGGTYTTTMANKSDGLLCTLLSLGCSAGTLYSGSDTSFGNGSTSSGESAAVSAQYGSNETWDYYESTFRRQGIFGTGAGSYNRVHYGKDYVNAFWDGTKMTYGDGDGTNYGPLVSLDVAGHEMTHGVTENTAGLNYSGESGGLNESTSDIFGTMVEFFANNPSDPGDYLIGEQFDLKKHLGLRRMDDPAKADASLDCWSSNAKNVDVHYSSGIGNHFFYLLSEGSGPKTINGVAYDSPTCNGSTVSGIGRNEAAAIWYRALTTYFTSSTDYAGARAATLRAAGDLYGTNSPQYDTVASAWSAVSVS